MIVAGAANLVVVVVVMVVVFAIGFGVGTVMIVAVVKIARTKKKKKKMVAMVAVAMIAFAEIVGNNQTFLEISPLNALSMLMSTPDTGQALGASSTWSSTRIVQWRERPTF